MAISERWREVNNCLSRDLLQCAKDHTDNEPSPESAAS